MAFNHGDSHAGGLRLRDVRLYPRQRSGCDAGGFLPIVPRDCVGDRAIGPHEANLFDIGQKYGNVVESRDLEGIVDLAG